MSKKPLLLLLALAASQLVTVSLTADPVSGQLFYTIFSGAPNVKSVAFSFNGTSTFTLGAPAVIGTTPGADGIVGDPQNSNLLIVGGQGASISTITKTTGTVTTYSTPVSAFHLAVPDSTTLLASGIPGALARHTILPGGALSAGSVISVTGADTTVTTIISTPTGYYYTDAGSGGFGNFGTIAFNSAIGTATSAVTTRLLTGIPSAHGGAFDPFTGDIMLFGDSNIGQFDIGTNSLVQRPFAGMNFDQGAVDGLGHMYVASNTGNLLFMDYSTSGIITSGSSFAATPFLDSNLDDVAPLIGGGGTGNNTPDSGSTLPMLGAALATLVFLRRRFA